MKFAAAMMVVLLGEAAAGQCDPQWMNGWGRPGPNGRVHTLSKFDFDGPGPLEPELVVGGRFSMAGGALCGSAARWDGNRWLALGLNTSSQVYGFASFDADGAGSGPSRLFAAASFDPPGPPEWRHSVFAWTGEDWEDVAPGIQLGASVIETFDPDGEGPLPARLVAGGADAAWTPTAFRAIAQWDGVQWLPMGQGLFGWDSNNYARVEAMTVFDPDGPGPHPNSLIVAGRFERAGSTIVNSIAAWDGASWHPLGTGLANAAGVGSAVVAGALVVHDEDGPGPQGPSLFVGGAFRRAGGVAVGNLARWDGNSWSDVGQGVSVNTPSSYAGVLGLASHDLDGSGPDRPSLIVSGRFDLAGSVPALNVAAWNEGAWEPLTSAGVLPYPESEHFPVASFKPRGAESPVLVGAGRFAFENQQLLLNMAAWDGAWAPVSRGFAGRIREFAAFDADGSGPQPTELIAAGDFSLIDEEIITGLARFDGRTWRSLGQAGPAIIQAMSILDLDGPGPLPQEVWVSGAVPALGSAFGVAAWNGSSWRRIGSTPEYVRCFGSFDFDGNGPQSPRVLSCVGYYPMTIRVWDGASWNPLGSPFFLSDTNRWEAPEMTVMLTHDFDGVGGQPPALVVAGRFDHLNINGVNTPIHSVARWDGSEWRPIGNGLLDFQVKSAVPFDSDGAGPEGPWLVAVGRHYWSQEAAFVWKGTAWEPFGLAVPASDVKAHDIDGPGGLGDTLFAAIEPGVVQWLGGTSWQWVGPPPERYATFDVLEVWRQSPTDVGQVVVGGSFEFAGGGTPSASFGRFTCGACYANCDNSTSTPLLTANDFICFLARFASGDSYANCDASTSTPILTATDFHCFMNAYTAGCP